LSIKIFYNITSHGRSSRVDEQLLITTSSLFSTCRTPAMHGFSTRPVNTVSKTIPVFTGRVHGSWTRRLCKGKGLVLI